MVKKLFLFEIEEKKYCFDGLTLKIYNIENKLYNLLSTNHFSKSIKNIFLFTD